MNKYCSAWVGLLSLLTWSTLAGSAQAHIKLLEPAPWLNEDDVGGPQKGGPCGPGGFDDVQPVPLSMEVTTVTAGDMLMVEFEETVHHPGWFRIALAEDPSEFEEIEFPNADNCNYDMSMVPTAPHGNVLADGLGMDTDISGPNRKFMELVKLPDTPCEKCTLQVIQVMADALHAPPNCIYYHCAELRILPKAGVAAGSAGSAATAGAGAAGAGGASALPAAGSGNVGAAGAQSPAGAAGSSVAGTAGAVAIPPATPATPAESAPPRPANEGCSVTQLGARSGIAQSSLWLALAALWLRRRKQRA